MANISSAFLQRALTLRHMRLLVALEDLRQVGRVAAALNISQPAVSKALAEIENGVGVALFERTPRGMVPTAHGACLLRYAHMMTNEITRAVDELTGHRAGHRRDAWPSAPPPAPGPATCSMPPSCRAASGCRS